MKMKIMAILLLTVSSVSQARLTEPGYRDPGDLSKVKEVDTAALERERLAQFEARTKNAERILTRNAIAVLARQAEMIKIQAKSDSLDDVTYRRHLREYASDMSGEARDLIHLSEGDYDKARVGLLRDSLNHKLFASVFTLYKSEVGRNEQNFISSLK